MSQNPIDEKQLIPAPEIVNLFSPTTKSIVLLAQLMVHATRPDFKMIPPAGFKLLKYPDSFRASVVQVTNRGYDAFNEAHNRMAQLAMYSERAETISTNILSLILTGESSDIEDFLPLTIDELDGVVQKCVTMTITVVGKFDDTLNLAREILAACLAANIDIQDALSSVIHEFEGVKGQWVYLENFFQGIVKILKGSWVSTIDSLIASIKTGSDEECKTLTKEVEQISVVAKKVHETTQAYSSISHKFLLKGILNLSKLATFNPTKDFNAIQGMIQEIISDCGKAEHAITNKI